MVALAGSDLTKDGNEDIGIVAKCIRAEGGGWAEGFTEGNGSNWGTRLVVQKKSEGPPSCADEVWSRDQGQQAICPCYKQCAEERKTRKTDGLILLGL